MHPVTVRGYCDPLSAAPGDSVTFHVSCDTPGPFEARLLRIILGDEDPKGPGAKFEVIESSANRTYDGITQRTQVGGYVEIAKRQGLVDPAAEFTVHAFIFPTLPAYARQALLSQWSDATSHGWALTIEDGRLTFAIGGEDGVSKVASDKALFSEVWYSVTATYDPRAGRLTVTQKTVVNSVNSRFGLIVPLDSDTTTTVALGGGLTVPDVPALIGGLSEGPGVRNWATALYAGKIDSPKVVESSLTEAEVVALATGSALESGRLRAHWDFSAGINPKGIGTDRVIDTSGHGFDGMCVNTPDRAMTGWNWTSEEENFVHAPGQYGAIWFHPDSIDDSRWAPSVELSLPADIRSGVYALEVSQGADREYIVFFVTPPRGTASAKTLLLMSTFTYLAYANQAVATSAAVSQSVFAHTTILHENEIEIHERSHDYGLSTYDYHVDGRGVQYSTWRRPIMNLRPQQRYNYSTMWNFTTDLHLVNWLEALGFEYDIATDHDLHREGADLLRRYNVVVTSTHPEYYSTEMVDAWEQYLATGGRGMYLGGNGMYWIAVPHPEKPFLIEVRRGEQGDQGWRARPGEYFHSHSGERGGLWRMRGRATQRIWGVGFTAHAMSKSAPFYQLPDAHDPRVAWIMEGIAPDEPIGDFGLVGQGAAGQEFDRYDLSLGTPPNTLLLASSYGHTQYDMLIPEDQFFPAAGMNGEEHPLVRGDITFFTTANGGAMFAAPSMTWATSLAQNNYQNNVSRLTANVLNRFQADVRVPPME